MVNGKNGEYFRYVRNDACWDICPTANCGQRCHQLEQKTIFSKRHVNKIHSLTTLGLAPHIFVVVKCIKRCIITLALLVATSTTRDEL